jgi:hypothetical protein
MCRNMFEFTVSWRIEIRVAASRVPHESGYGILPCRCVVAEHLVLCVLPNLGIDDDTLESCWMASDVLLA